MKNENPKKQRNKYLILTGVAFQMGITIYLMVYLGKRLDLHYQNTNKFYTIIFTLLGVSISLYAMNKQVQKINN